MSKLPGTLLVLIAILFACLPATAQNLGDRVRVATAVDTVIGDVSGTSENSLMLVIEDGESREFTHAEVQRLEVYKKTGERQWWGVLLGGFVGLSVAEATAPERLVTQRQCIANNLFGECTQMGDVLVPAPDILTPVGVITMVAGAATGYLLGRRLNPAKWYRVPHPANSLETEERFRENTNRLILNPIVDAQPGVDESLRVILGMSVRF